MDGVNVVLGSRGKTREAARTIDRKGVESPGAYVVN